MYQYILFDLDGTLTDSREGITKSVQFALQDWGIYEEDLSKFECFIGPPLRDSFLNFYPETVNMTNVEAVIKKYRERFEKTGIFENSMYEGIPELLEKMKEHGKILAVASSKPEVFVRRILDYFSVTKYFDVIVGSLLDGSRENKDEVIHETLRQLYKGEISKENKEQTVMIGDRKFDIEGAKKLQVPNIGVRYGFANENELEEAGAEQIADTVAELQALLLK